MSSPWFTFGVVRNNWRLTSVPLPFEFSAGVRLMHVPEWVYVDADYDPLRATIVKELNDDRICIGVDYLADAMGSPDPNWDGIEKRDIQTSATEAIHRLMLALWLTKRVCVGGDVIVDTTADSGEWITRRIGSHDAMLTLPPFERTEFELADIERAKLLYSAMESLPANGNVSTALNSTIRALTELTFPIRLIMLWLVVEGLFGPEDAREISYRLGMRLAFFLEGRSGNARELFRKCKESYTWRSKLVHGLRVKEIRADEPTRLLSELEDIVCRSLIKILSSDELPKVFNSKRREKYLDEVVFDGT